VQILRYKDILFLKAAKLLHKEIVEGHPIWATLHLLVFRKGTMVGLFHHLLAVHDVEALAGF